MDVVMNKISYPYSMMGINILSEIELPGIVSNEENYDAKIILNTIDLEMAVEQEYNNFFAMNEKEFICDIKNVAKYKITNGNLIQIDLYEQCDMELVKVYLLGTCMGVLLFQKEQIAIHGSAIVINNKALIITGQCGAGKSTLSTALQLKGYSILSDDISPVIMLENGIVLSAPAFSNQRICHDTAVNLGIDVSHLEKACSEDLKYNIDISGKFLDHPIELFGVIQVIPSEVEKVELIEVHSFKKFELIKSNIYCKEFYSTVDYPPIYFKKIINLANKVHAYQMIRPVGQFTVERQIELLLQEIAKSTNGGKNEG